MHKFEINGKEFHLTPLDVKTGRRLQTRLAKACGGHIIDLLKAQTLEEMNGVKDPKAVQSRAITTIASAIKGILQDLPEELFEDLVSTFSKQCLYMDGSKGGALMSVPAAMNDAFQDQYGDLISWLFKCLDCTYGAFYRSLGLSQNPS